MRHKAQRFKEETTKFVNSDKTANDIVRFVIESSVVLRQGDGLSWHEIIQIVENVTGQQYSRDVAFPEERNRP